MKPFPVAACAAALAVVPFLSAGEPPAPSKEKKADSQLHHAVFFTLKDKTPAAREKLIEACKKYLTAHQGEVSFSVGARAEEFARDVNDKDFDVALDIVFASKAAHDAYTSSARHDQFLKECQDGWQKVRVFDSYVSPYKAAVKEKKEKKDKKARKAVKAGKSAPEPEEPSDKDEK